MTAISVSRDCGMVLPNENIALIELDSYNNFDDSDSHEAPKLTVNILGDNSLNNKEDYVINFNDLVKVVI